MKKNAIISFCLIILLLLVSIFSYNNYINTKTNDIRTINLKDLEYKEFNLSKEDYIEDFNFAYNTLKEHYPFFEVNKKLYGIDWLANKEKYEEYIAESKNDADFFNRMTYVLGEIHNRHTHLMQKILQWLRIRLTTLFQIAPGDMISLKCMRKIMLEEDTISIMKQ